MKGRTSVIALAVLIGTLCIHESLAQISAASLDNKAAGVFSWNKVETEDEEFECVSIVGFSRKILATIPGFFAAPSVGCELRSTRSFRNAREWVSAVSNPDSDPERTEEEEATLERVREALEDARGFWIMGVFLWEDVNKNGVHDQDENASQFLTPTDGQPGALEIQTPEETGDGYYSFSSDSNFGRYETYLAVSAPVYVPGLDDTISPGSMTLTIDMKDEAKATVYEAGKDQYLGLVLGFPGHTEEMSQGDVYALYREINETRGQEASPYIHLYLPDTTSDPVEYNPLGVLTNIADYDNGDGRRQRTRMRVYSKVSVDPNAESKKLRIDFGLLEAEKSSNENLLWTSFFAAPVFLVGMYAAKGKKKLRIGAPPPPAPPSSDKADFKSLELDMEDDPELAKFDLDELERDLSSGSSEGISGSGSIVAEWDQALMFALSASDPVLGSPASALSGEGTSSGGEGSSKGTRAGPSTTTTTTTTTAISSHHNHHHHHHHHVIDASDSELWLRSLLETDTSGKTLERLSAASPETVQALYAPVALEAPPQPAAPSKFASPSSSSSPSSSASPPSLGVPADGLAANAASLAAAAGVPLSPQLGRLPAPPTPVPPPESVKSEGGSSSASSASSSSIFVLDSSIPGYTPSGGPAGTVHGKRVEMNHVVDWHSKMMYRKRDDLSYGVWRFRVDCLSVSRAFSVSIRHPRGLVMGDPYLAACDAKGRLTKTAIPPGSLFLIGESSIQMGRIGTKAEDEAETTMQVLIPVTCARFPSVVYFRVVVPLMQDGPPITGPHLMSEPLLVSSSSRGIVQDGKGAYEVPILGVITPAFCSMVATTSSKPTAVDGGVKVRLTLRSGVLPADLSNTSVRFHQRILGIDYTTTNLERVSDTVLATNAPNINVAAVVSVEISGVASSVKLLYYEIPE